MVAGVVAQLAFSCSAAGCASGGLRAHCNSKFACPCSTPIFWSIAFEVAVNKKATSSWAASLVILAFLQMRGRGPKKFYFCNFPCRTQFRVEHEPRITFFASSLRKTTSCARNQIFSQMFRIGTVSRPFVL